MITGSLVAIVTPMLDDGRLDLEVAGVGTHRATKKHKLRGRRSLFKTTGSFSTLAASRRFGPCSLQRL